PGARPRLRLASRAARVTMQVSLRGQTSAVFVNLAFLLTNRWSTRGEPIASPALASPPCSGIQTADLRRPLYNAGSQKRQHGTGGGFFLRRACHFLSPRRTFFPEHLLLPFAREKSQLLPNHRSRDELR